MKKSEEFLAELEDGIPEYIKSVGSFQYESETYSLVRHYRSDIYSTCQICGHERIIDIYVVMDSSGKNWRVGNVCIDRISSQKISGWFKSYILKRDNIEKNAPLIDEVAEILEDYENRVLPTYISEVGIERLKKMLDRMHRGLDPLQKTIKLARYYTNKIVRARLNT
jgi:hypothetical protein